MNKLGERHQRLKKNKDEMFKQSLSKLMFVLN